MQRVLVVGSGGSGKSTLARELGRLLVLPVMHLDAVYWRSAWDGGRGVGVCRARPVVDAGMGDGRELRWHDGYPPGALRYGDLPRPSSRAVPVAHPAAVDPVSGSHAPRPRAGMSGADRWEFIAWVWSYPTTRRLQVLRRLTELQRGQRAIILTSSGAVRRFLADVASHRPLQPPGAAS